MIANKDNYLLLKQFIVILESTRLGAELKINNGTPITLVGALGMITGLTKTIEEDFTVPYVALSNAPVAIDIAMITSAINQACGNSPIEPELAKDISESNTPEGIERCVTQFPVFENIIKMHVTNLDNESYWKDTRGKVGALIAETSAAIKTIQAWANRECELELIRVLIIVNMIELVDRLFAYLNDFYGVENNDPERSETA